MSSHASHFKMPTIGQTPEDVPSSAEVTSNTMTEQTLLTDKNNANLRIIEEENRRLKEQKMCKVCFDQTARIVFLPCRHLVCCKKCAINPSMTNCPVCRTEIRDRMPIRYERDADMNKYDDASLHQAFSDHLEDDNGAVVHFSFGGDETLPTPDLPSPRT